MVRKRLDMKFKKCSMNLFIVENGYCYVDNDKHLFQKMEIKKNVLLRENAFAAWLNADEVIYCH